MGLYKRGKIWWIAITIDGKQKCFSTKTSDRKIAEQIYAKVLLKLDNQESNPRQQIVTYWFYCILFLIRIEFG